MASMSDSAICRQLRCVTRDYFRFPDYPTGISKNGTSRSWKRGLAYYQQLTNGMPVNRA
jgi:hypothetical protein